MAPWNEESDHGVLLSEERGGSAQGELSSETIVYFSVFCTLLVMAFIIMCVKMGHIRQKTRNPQQRRMYVGTQRQSLGAMGQEPTIYVSPSNLPPPPKYECMAPPSYDEVVGVHYPQFNAQPISQPISAALAQSQPIGTQNQTSQPISGPSQSENVTAVTVVNEDSRTSVTVART